MNKAVKGNKDSSEQTSKEARDSKLNLESESFDLWSDDFDSSLDSELEHLEIMGGGEVPDKLESHTTLNSKNALHELEHIFETLSHDKEKLEKHIKILNHRKNEIVSLKKVEIDQYFQEMRAQNLREIESLRESIRKEIKNEKETWYRQEELEKKQHREDLDREEKSLRERVQGEVELIKNEAKNWSREVISSAERNAQQLRDQLESERRNKLEKIQEEKELLTKQYHSLEERYKDNIKMLRTEYEHASEMIKEKKEISVTTMELLKSTKVELTALEIRFEKINRELQKKEATLQTINEEHDEMMAKIMQQKQQYQVAIDEQILLMTTKKEQVMEAENKLKSILLETNFQKERMLEEQRINIDEIKKLKGEIDQLSFLKIESEKNQQQIQQSIDDSVSTLDKYEEKITKMKALLEKEKQDYEKLIKTRDRENQKLESIKLLMEKYKNDNAQLLSEKNKIEAQYNDINNLLLPLVEQSNNAKRDIAQCLEIKEELHQMRMKLEQDRNQQIIKLGAKKRDFEREVQEKRDEISKMREVTEQEIVQLKIEEEKLLLAKQNAEVESKLVKERANHYAKKVQEDAEKKAKDLYIASKQEFEVYQNKIMEEWKLARKKQLGKILISLKALIKRRVEELGTIRKWKDELGLLLIDIPEISLKILEGEDVNVELLPELKSKLKSKRFLKKLAWMSTGIILFLIIIMTVPIRRIEDWGRSFLQEKRIRGSDTAHVEYYEKELAEKRKVHLQQSDTYKTTYFENVLYTTGYVEFKSNPELKKQWILELEKILVTDELMTENNYIKYVAVEAKLMRELQRIKQGLTSFNAEREMNKMKDLEKEYWLEVKGLLNFPDRLSFLKSSLASLEKNLWQERLKPTEKTETVK